MGILILLLFILHIIVLVCLYATDKRIKHISNSGIRQVNMLTLTRFKYYFVYCRRKKGLISKHAFVCMIVYYILNFTGFFIMSFQFITGNSSSLQTTCSILLFLNIGLVFLVSLQPALTFDQTIALKDYIDKEKWKQEGEKKDSRSLK